MSPTNLGTTGCRVKVQSSELHDIRQPALDRGARACNDVQSWANIRSGDVDGAILLAYDVWTVTIVRTGELLSGFVQSCDVNIIDRMLVKRIVLSSCRSWFDLGGFSNILRYGCLRLFRALVVCIGRLISGGVLLVVGGTRARISGTTLSLVEGFSTCQKTSRGWGRTRYLK